MKRDKFQLEQEAYTSLATLYEQATRCRSLCDEAGLTIPDGLQRMLGLNRQVGELRDDAGGLERPRGPSEADDDWLWIPVSDASPQTSVLAVLRAAEGPMRPRDILGRVFEIFPNATAGSIYNVGPRLDGKLIERGEGGWRLIDPKLAPVLHTENLWGPASVFVKQDLATHRRHALVHILKRHQSGLQVVQMVETLRKCGWMKAPANKDLLKLDVEILSSAGKIEQRGNSRKWAIKDHEK